MLLRQYNRVGFTTATTGTGTMTVGSALTGARTIASAGIADGALVRYSIKDGSAWEDGLGTVGGSGTTLARTTIHESSGGTSAISLSGSAEVRLMPLAADLDALVRPPIAGKRIAAMGDSITKMSKDVTSTYSLQTAGYVTWTSVLSGQRLYYDTALNKGVEGESTSQMAARFDADIVANADSFDILFLHGGTNDPNVGTPVAKETTVSNLQTMATKALALGKLVMVLGILPRSDTTNTKKYAYVNRKIAEWAFVTPGVVFVDAWRTFGNTTANDGTVKSGLTTDGLHPNSYGAYLLGRLVWSALEPLCAAVPTTWSNPLDVYDATDNPLGNAITNSLLTGTGGSTGAGATGTVPTSWAVNKWAGSASASSMVFSTGANTDGAPGNYLQAAFSAVGATTDEAFDISAPWIAISSFGAAVGDQVYVELELEVVGTAKNINYISGVLRAGDASFASLFLVGQTIVTYGDTIPSLTVPGKFVLRSPVMTLPTSTTQVVFILSIKFDASASASATLRLSSPQIRKVG